jgi:molybdenum cofactor guanylyltransferase
VTRPAAAAGGEPGPYDAVLLTGGRASRLGGAPKPELVVGGLAMAARVLAAVGDADRRIVVGPAVNDTEVDLVTREEPRGGGPVAAIAAGLVGVRASAVAVLAADLPFLDAMTVLDLRAALALEPAAAAALLVDADGRDQRLCAVWRTEALRAALAAVGGPAGLPVSALVTAAGTAGTVVRRTGRPANHGGPPPWFDCDTPEDLAAARSWAGLGRAGGK